VLEAMVKKQKKKAGMERALLNSVGVIQKLVKQLRIADN